MLIFSSLDLPLEGICTTRFRFFGYSGIGRYTIILLQPTLSTPWALISGYWKFCKYYHQASYFQSVIHISYCRKQFSNKKLSFIQVLRLYRCVKLVSVRYTQAFSRLYLPSIVFMAQFIIVVISAFTLLFYDRIGVLNIYISLTCIFCNIFVVGTITTVASKVTDSTDKILKELEASDHNNLSNQNRVILRSLREIRIYIGTLYYADPGTVLVTFNIVVSNLINVLLFYREKIVKWSWKRLEDSSTTNYPFEDFHNYNNPQTKLTQR